MIGDLRQAWRMIGRMPALAAFASWLPARRATSVDVMVALRQD